MKGVLPHPPDLPQSDLAVSLPSGFFRADSLRSGAYLFVEKTFFSLQGSPLTLRKVPPTNRFTSPSSVSSVLLVRPALTSGPVFLMKEIELWVRSCMLAI